MYPNHVNENWQDCGIISTFGRNGTALSQEERVSIAKRRGVCLKCGIRTHAVGLWSRTPLTNEDVHQGICIRDYSSSVSPAIWQEWQVRNAQTAAVKPVGQLKTAEVYQENCTKDYNPNHFKEDLPRCGIPYFAKDGTALTPEERASIAKRRGLCLKCGIQTHALGMLGRTPLTNEEVHQGICIRDYSSSVPPTIWQEWQVRNAQTAVVKPVSKSAIPTEGVIRRK